MSNPFNVQHCPEKPSGGNSSGQEQHFLHEAIAQAHGPKAQHDHHPARHHHGHHPSEHHHGHHKHGHEHHGHTPHEQQSHDVQKSDKPGARISGAPHNDDVGVKGGPAGKLDFPPIQNYDESCKPGAGIKSDFKSFNDSVTAAHGNTTVEKKPEHDVASSLSAKGIPAENQSAFGLKGPNFSSDMLQKSQPEAQAGSAPFNIQGPNPEWMSKYANSDWTSKYVPKAG